MLKKLAAVLIAATVVGAPMVATAQPVATQNRTVVKVVKPHKVVVVKKHAAHRHHVKRVKVVSGHRHGHHVTVVKHRKPIKHVHRHDGSKTVVIKKVTRTY